jgi:hypothetical protein
MPEVRTHPQDDAARLHERAAVFFDLLDQRERADLERARARRARTRATDGERTSPGGRLKRVS